MRFFKQDTGLFLKKATGWKVIGHIQVKEFYPDWVDSRENPEVLFHPESKMFTFVFNNAVVTLSVTDSINFYKGYIMNSDYDTEIFENYSAWILMHEIGD